MMQATPLERPDLVQTAVHSLAIFAAIALLALVLAYWTWAWFAPRPEPRAPAAPQADGRAIALSQASLGLFGGARADGNGAAPAAGSIRLLGIVAATGNQAGYAVLRLDGKQTVAVAQGAEVEPGLRLVQVQVDHIVLDRNGGREKLAWPEKTGK